MGRVLTLSPSGIPFLDAAAAGPIAVKTNSLGPGAQTLVAADPFKDVVGLSVAFDVTGDKDSTFLCFLTLVNVGAIPGKTQVDAQLVLVDPLGVPTFHGNPMRARSVDAAVSITAPCVGLQAVKLAPAAGYVLKIQAKTDLVNVVLPEFESQLVIVTLDGDVPIVP